MKTQQDIIDDMKLKADKMEALVDEFDLYPTDYFDSVDVLKVAIDERGGGYPKFFGDPDPTDLQKRWLAITTQLAKYITNPHIGRDDMKAVFYGFGKLGVLYAEKFKKP